MRWDDRLLDLFEDLEQQAEGLHLAERDSELVDRRRGEYVSVTFASRLHASVGSSVALTVTGVGPLTGTLTRVGDGWCLLETALAAQEWLVCLPAVRRATDLSERSVTEAARPVSARLPLRAALRGLADGQTEVVTHGMDGDRCTGRVGRVGADFVELVGTFDGAWSAQDSRRVDVLPLETLAAVRRTEP